MFWASVFPAIAFRDDSDLVAVLTKLPLISRDLSSRRCQACNRLRSTASLLHRRRAAGQRWAARHRPPPSVVAASATGVVRLGIRSGYGGHHQRRWPRAPAPSDRAFTPTGWRSAVSTGIVQCPAFLARRGRSDHGGSTTADAGRSDARRPARVTNHPSKSSVESRPRTVRWGLAPPTAAESVGTTLRSPVRQGVSSVPISCPGAPAQQPGPPSGSQYAWIGCRCCRRQHARDPCPAGRTSQPQLRRRLADVRSSPAQLLHLVGAQFAEQDAGTALTDVGARERAVGRDGSSGRRRPH